MLNFFSTAAGAYLLSLLVGAAIAAAAYYSTRVGNLPALSKVRSAYPVLDLVVKIANDSLRGTPYGLLSDAAYQIWIGKGYSGEQAAKYAEAMVKYFDVEKYIGTDWDALSPAQIEQGKNIAEKILPSYARSQGAA